MAKFGRWASFGLGLSLIAVAAPAAAMHKSASKAGKQELIDSAMSAAPAAVAKDAKIVTINKKGKMETLREGGNGFTCMPDNPVTPGPDPMCMDPNAMDFINAWVGHTAPASDKVGLVYMLAGGTDASNTDPFAAGPTEGNHWVSTGPHIMIVGTPVKTSMSGYPRAADPDTSKPYVMWAGTPYEHLMIPVK